MSHEFLSFCVSFFRVSFVQYVLTLVASDSLNEMESEIIIHVKDVNDLPPVFGEKLYQAAMFEEQKTSRPMPLLQVK